MAISIIVEDGSLVNGANSYVNLATARQFALNRGKSLPASDDEANAALIRAMDYIEAKRRQFKGVKVSPTQSLQWPRKCVDIDGEDFPENAIPIELKNAQCQLALEAATIDLMPTSSGAFVIREKTGPIETEYSETISTSGSPNMPAVEAFLAPLLSVGSFRLQVARA